jgi:hypothetical protein
MSEHDTSDMSEKLDKRLSAVEVELNKMRELTQEEPQWNLGIVHIKRSTDLIALVAFVLSISTLGAQIAGYLKRAELVSFSPYQIVIGTKEAMDKPRSDDSVLFAATTQYINESLSGHIGIVQREYLRFRVGGSKTQHQYGPYEIVKTNVSEKGKLTVPSKEDPGAFVVSAESPITHEVLFQPFADSGCLLNDAECKTFDTKTWYGWNDFKNDIIPKNDKNELTTIYVTIISTILDRKWIFWYDQYLLESRCTVTLSTTDRQTLISQQWLAPECKRT